MATALFSDAGIEWLARPHISRVWFAALDLPSGVQYIHSGVGTFTHDGHDWLGIADPVGGRLVSMSQVEEPVFGQAASINFILSGVTAEFLQEWKAMAREMEGRPADVYWAAFDPETWQIWPDGLVAMFPSGRISSPGLHRIGLGVRAVSLTVESEFAAMNFPTGEQWSDADLQRRYPGVRGFEYLGQQISEQWL